MMYLDQDGAGESTSLMMDNTKFVDNRATGGGGGLSIHGPGTNIQLHGVNFTQNEAQQMGGAVAAYHSEILTAKNSTFLANTSPFGGAIFCQGAQQVGIPLD